MKEGITLDEKLKVKGISRRDFMKYCTALTATVGLSSSFVPKVANAFESASIRPPVIWLHFAECTGCSEALLRTHYPYIDELILDVLSIEYHETIMAASGELAEKQLYNSVDKYKGEFICIVEGSIPMSFDGGYGKVSGKSFLDIASNVCSKAKAVISVGTCAAFGGLPAADPNPGGFKGVSDAIDVSTINISGCPPNPVNIVGTILHYLLLNELPKLDKIGRPLFAYSKTVHDQCPRRSHFENEEFVEEFGSKEASMGYCLYKLGCKGPDTYNNCPIAKFNDGTSWPVEAGHPCIGCSEPNFWDEMTPFYENG